jgi:fatty acid desaturase
VSQFPQAEAAIDPHERPTAITIICIIGFIGAALAVPAFFMVAMGSLPPWYPVWLGISTVIGLATLIGLVHLHRFDSDQSGDSDCNGALESVHTAAPWDHHCGDVHLSV